MGNPYHVDFKYHWTLSSGFLEEKSHTPGMLDSAPGIIKKYIPTLPPCIGFVNFTLFFDRAIGASFADFIGSCARMSKHVSPLS